MKDFVDTNYRVVEAGGTVLLEELVNDLIEYGYLPMGDLKITYPPDHVTPYDITYSQVMLKETIVRDGSALIHSPKVTLEEFKKSRGFYD